MIRDLNANVIRYVVTRLDSEGCRVMLGARQGRNTYATPEAAQAWIDAARKNNNATSIAFLNPDSWEVRACKCWPVHFDPKEYYFDMEKIA